jgi:predicted metal-dependent HD superfamily phosphohydrolase
MLDETRWNNLESSLCERPPGSDYYPALVAAYSEPHRHYHNAGHIERCLREFDTTKTLAQHPEEVEFAIWLHDAVYDPRAHDNEEKGAQWAADILTSLSCAEAVVCRVKDLILATKHQVILREPDALLLVDIDLSIIGQPPEVYDNYEKSVRAEYDWVPAAAYKIGRRQILQSFSERPRIFQTDFYYELYEKQARQNLGKAIAALGQ